MAIPHFSVTAISRGAGRSAVAAAAYRHGGQMEIEATGDSTKNYSSKTKEIVHAEIMLPGGVASWAEQRYGHEALARFLAEIEAEGLVDALELAEGESGESEGLREAFVDDVAVSDSATLSVEIDQLDQGLVKAAWARIAERLWNDIEGVEASRNKFPWKAMMAREITVALPNVLSHDAQIELMRGFIAQGFTSRGMVVDMVIHDKGDGNPHAHLMIPTRSLDVDAWGGKDRTLHDRSAVRELRMLWQEHANLMLEREGFPDRIDMRTLQAQGIELVPANFNPHVANNAEEAGQKPLDKVRCEDVKLWNRQRILENPDYILVVVQAKKAVFTSADLVNELVDRLDMAEDELPRDLVRAVTRSEELVPVAQRTAEGKQLYITRGRAAQATQVAEEAATLRDSCIHGIEMGSNDAFESGTGPILLDISEYVAEREAAAEAQAQADRRRKQPARRERRDRGPSLEVVRDALDQRAENLFRQVFGEPVRPGAGEWRAKDDGSVSMQMQGPRRGLWFQHSSGEGGNLFDLVAREMCGLSNAKQNFPRVLEVAASWAGIGAGQEPDWSALEERRAAREKQDAEHERRKEEERRKLVSELLKHARPLRASPAALYLSDRGISVFPDDGIAYLPPVPGLPVRGAEHCSLIIWARDDAGEIVGGQRILIAEDGDRIDTDVRKPGFGQIGGAPARFMARDGRAGPLVIAEGPESALAIHEATGLETWAVFGVSGFESAPVPADREVILAPDRDSPESPAGKAFRKAVTKHLANGCQLSVAMAPEPSGSKRDLNDTLQSAGLAAVREAIETARPVRIWLSGDLTAGQREAAEAMMGPSRLTLVAGHAGTGKTHTLRAVAEAWRARGIEVLAGAPSGKATQELGQIAGVRAATLSAWESRWERGDTPHDGNFVFIMDEAAMVGASQWAHLQARILGLGGKLIAFGDPEQLQPVSDLPGWAAAVNPSEDIPTITEVVRQTDERDRAAVAALARGGSAAQRGIQHYIDKGALRLEPEIRSNPHQAMAEAYWRSHGEHPDRSRIALAHSNRDVDMLNANIRHVAVRNGIVRDETAVKLTVDRDRRVMTGRQSRTRRTAVTIRLAAGDRVMLTAPMSDHELPRSAFGTVESVTSEGHLRVIFDGSSDAVTIDPATTRRIDYGYAATVHKSQGMTSDEVFVLPHGRMDYHSIYVALSRHRESVTVFGRSRHLESWADLYRLSAQRSSLPKAPNVNTWLSAVPMPDTDITFRPDWSGENLDDEDNVHGAVAGDPHLLSVATRIAGLLSADHHEDAPILKEGPSVRPDHIADPKTVIEGLVNRYGVIRAEEIASELAKSVADPVTFLRLFEEAMAHPTLVALPGEMRGRDADQMADTASDPYVYTTKAHLRKEVSAVDRAMRIGWQASAPEGKHSAGAIDIELSDEQQTALGFALEHRGQGIRMIEGGIASGKTRLAAAVALAHEAEGRVTTVLAVSEAGRRALLDEGVHAQTVDEFLTDKMPVRRKSDPEHVIVVDDAHGLGMVRGDVLLARAEIMQAGVVAMVDPSQRPMEPGALFRALRDRIPSISLEGMVGLHDSAGPVAGLIAALRAGTPETYDALVSMAEEGAAVAVEGLEAAITTAARDYVSDPSASKVALAWSRNQVDQITSAIRAELDVTVPERSAASSSAPDVIGDLKQGDRIRFTVTGPFGGQIEVGPDGKPVPDGTTLVLRGETAEVLRCSDDGTVSLRVHGEGRVSRVISVVRDGPLPAWHYNFASTITAASGTRYDSVHLLASPQLDRAMLAGAVGVAQERVRLILPVGEQRFEATLKSIASRERVPRTALDHGFEPAKAGDAAVYSKPPKPRPEPLPDPEIETGPSGYLSVPKVRLKDRQLRRDDLQYLQKHPEHILAILQVDRPVFTEAEIRQALRQRLGAAMTEDRIVAIVEKVMTSGLLVSLERTSPTGAAQYMTTARSAMLHRTMEEARRLAAGRFQPGTMPVGRGDVLRGLTESQADAVQQMTDDRRLTMIQGHAGTGKTHALGTAARIWRERGVTVIGGAASGKATSELEGIDGVQARTLAGWEARWARGERPDGPFVFIMDEAGMVGAGQWSRIQSRVLALGGKLIAVGDPDQLQPVADLPGWSIAERAVQPGSMTVLSQVVRQIDVSDRIATERLARGGANVDSVVRYYLDKGSLRLESEVRANPVAAIATAYVNDVVGDDGVSTRMAIAYTNRDVAELNNRIRGELLVRGVIDAESVREYGSVQRVAYGDDGRIQHGHIPLRLGVGERVMLTRALPEHDLPRSSFGTVVAVRDGALEVRFDQHGLETAAVTIGRIDLDALDYGYAATIHKSQGMTADSVFVLPHRRMHRHATYVAMSRHRTKLEVYGRAGHFDRPAELVAMGQAAGHLDFDASDLVANEEARAVPWAGGEALLDRADWRAEGAELGRVGFVGDPDLMAVAERTVGLFEVNRRRGARVEDDLEGYRDAPVRVVDGLIRRSSVFRADDVAQPLARISRSSDEFLRLFREAMSHSDLVVLSDGDRIGTGRVYTTRTQLQTELDVVDRGMRMGLGATPGESIAVPRRLKDVTPEQDRAIRAAMNPCRLTLITGTSGSGKSHVAADIARRHAETGWTVVGVAPTGSGLGGLRNAGFSRDELERSRVLTIGELLQYIDGGHLELGPKTLIVLDEANRIGAAEAQSILTRLEPSGAKLVALLDDGAMVPREAGPVFRALETRLGSVRLGGSLRWSDERERMMRDLTGNLKEARKALGWLAETGCLEATGAKAQSHLAAKVARSWLEDETWNKMALAWTNNEVNRINATVRKRLDRALKDVRKDYVSGVGGTHGKLKPADRIRIVKGTPWEYGLPAEQRWRAGDYAEYLGRDRRGRERFRVLGRDGRERDAVLPAGTELPAWKFAFASTIHAEAGNVFDSTHLMLKAGMSRQLVAAGARLHRDHLSILAPVEEGDELSRFLDRIAARDATPESVLDHGFDPSLAAREAMRRPSNEEVGTAHEPGAVAAAVDRLQRFAGFASPPPDTMPKDLEGEVMAELVGATMARTGEAPGAEDRLALEGHVTALSNPRSWRRILRQGPQDLPERADRLAAEATGRTPGSADVAPRLFTTARVLARGALAARVQGEDGVATLFEDALRSYGQAVATARLAARPEQLELEPKPVSSTSRTGPGEVETTSSGAESTVRPKRSRQNTFRPRRRAWRGPNLMRLFGGYRNSDERVAREMLEALLGSPRWGSRKRNIVHRSLAERKREEEWPGRSKALEAVRARAAAKGAADAAQVSALSALSPLPDMAQDNAALQLAIAITRRIPENDEIHSRDLVNDINGIINQAGVLPEPDDDGWSAFMRELGKHSWTEPEQELVRIMNKALADGAVPDVEEIRDARFDIIAEMAGQGVPGGTQALSDRLAANFTRYEINALRDPFGELPANLGHVGTAVRTGFASWLERWMPERDDIVAERNDGLRSDDIPVMTDAESGAEDEPRMEIYVNQLSAALTSRIALTKGVHGREMKQKISDALHLPSEGLDQQDVAELAAEIAQRRVEADIRVELVRSLSSAQVFETEARFQREPRFRSDLRKQYREELPKRLAVAKRKGVKPTDLEHRVARVAMAARGTPHERLANAMVEALGYGSVIDGMTLVIERSKLTEELAKPVRKLKPSEQRALVRRLHSYFTGTEILALAESRSIRGGAVANRRQVAESVRHLLTVQVTDRAPWRGQHDQLALTTGQVRTNVAGRSM